MNKKLAILYALALALSALFFSSCKKNNDPLTLIIKTPSIHIGNIGGSSNEAPGYKMQTLEFLQAAGSAFEAYYNENSPSKKIRVLVVGFSPQEETAFVRDTFGTPDSPDVLYESTFNMFGYINNGWVAPIDDLLTPAIMDDLHQASFKGYKVDGHLYVMPFFSLQNIIIYNRELLRKAGLDRFVSSENVIQNWSLSEWEEILATLKKCLPADVFPTFMYAKNSQGDTHTLTLLRMTGSTVYDDEGNFCLAGKEGVEALTALKRYYDAGFFPPNCEALEIENCRKLFELQKLCFFIGNSQLLQNYDVIDCGFVNFPSKTSKKGYCTTFDTGFCVFDNGNEEKLELAKDFVRYIYESNFIEHSARGLPASKKVVEKYKDQIFMLDEFYRNYENVWDYTGGARNWRQVREEFYKHIQDLFLGYKTPATVASDIDKTCNLILQTGRATSHPHK